MAKKALLTLGGTYHKVKKGYLTLDGVYRKVKKAYLTIGGAYRPCLSGGELAYYGTATPLAVARVYHTSAKAGNNALFAGGQDDSGKGTKAVEAYDGSLTRSSIADLYVAGRNAGANIGGKALFASYSVDVYDESLTKGALDLSVRRTLLGGAFTNSHALFAGGYASTLDSVVNTVDAFDSSLVRTTGELSRTAQYPAGGCVGDYALFASGSTSGSFTKIVDAFDSSLTRQTISQLPAILGTDDRGITVGNYVLFAGHPSKNNVTAYDESLVQSTVTPLSVIRNGCAAVSIENFGIFAGGYHSSTNHKTIDVYDANLTMRTLEGKLSSEKINARGEAVGNYALITGGRTSSYVNYGTTTVEALIIS